MRVFKVALALTVFLLALPACRKDKAKVLPVEKNAEELTPEQARQALMAMLEKSEASTPSYLPLLLPRLQAEPIVSGDQPGQIAIGPWWCHLPKKIFTVTLSFPRAFRMQVEESGGVFERSGDGRWRARITWCSSNL